MHSAVSPTFVDSEDKFVVSDLAGEIIPSRLVEAATREELTEMYRRSVWTEVPTADCRNVTGKPPIPVRWVITNKGDKVNYNVRARLVAKHLVAKYGGTGLHELFAAMPPFEMVKLLLVRALSKCSRTSWQAAVPLRARDVRKIMFVVPRHTYMHA